MANAARRTSVVAASHIPNLTAAGCLTFFLGLSLTHLDRFPVAIQDEPWIVAPAVKLATHGVYGSDLFFGYYGIGQHDFQSMPAYPLLVAAVFKTLGVGLVQARLISVLLGALTVMVTYVEGRRLVGRPGAALAAALLVIWRVTTYGPVFGSGVPLLDVSRIARYDVAVPALVILACGMLVRGLERKSGRRVTISGALIGLASLCQLYGAFWLPVLGLLIIWRGDRGSSRPRYLSLVATGFTAMMLPWLIYVMLHWADYAGQMRFYQPHFRFYDPGFYLMNLMHEYQRYPVRLWSGYPSPGVILLLAGVPAALFALLREARRTGDVSMAAVGLGLAIPMALFALADSEKMFNHILAVFPFAALIVGWAIVRLWGIERRARPAVRVAVMAGLVALAIYGAAGVMHQRQVAASTMPYARFEARLARLLPTHVLVLGSPQFQLGLRSHPYRSLLLPFLLSDPTTRATPLTFETALERVAPGVILIERPVYQYLEANARAGSADHAVYAGFRAYLRRWHGRLAGKVAAADYFYSPVRVYVVHRSP